MLGFYAVAIFPSQSFKSRRPIVHVHPAQGNTVHGAEMSMSLIPSSLYRDGRLRADDSTRFYSLAVPEDMIEPRP